MQLLKYIVQLSKITNPGSWESNMCNSNQSHFPSTFLSQDICLKLLTPALIVLNSVRCKFKWPGCLLETKFCWVYTGHSESKYSAFFVKLNNYSTFKKITYNQKNIKYYLYLVHAYWQKYYFILLSVEIKRNIISELTLSSV